MEKKFKLTVSSMPNFISIERPAGLRQEGFSEGFKIDIVELTESEANEYAELMKNSFIEHYNNRKQRKKI